MKGKTVTQYEAQIIDQREKLKKAKDKCDSAIDRELKRWGKIAEQYSLFDSKIPDDQLHELFRNLASNLDETRNSAVFLYKQKANRTQLKLSSMTTQQRKQDAHEKIQLGGLVIKAGLRDENPEIILGALLDLKKSLDTGDQAKLDALSAVGSEALKETK